MHYNPERASVTLTNGDARRAFGLPDFMWLLFFLALLIAILLPSFARARELAKRAVCAANLRGIGQSIHIYSNDNWEWFPHHYYETTYRQTAGRREHGVRWVGTMGSNDFLKITEDTARKSPKRNHPSRSLFLLITQGSSTTKQFICPSSGDVEDELRNHAVSSRDPTRGAAQPGINRFDFRGYNTLSYGYQLPYGDKGRPTQNLDVRMAIMADKGPYYAAGGAGLAGTNTVRDKRSDVSPPEAWAQRSERDILTTDSKNWRPYNSRNHRGEGQNVLYIDDHVDFNKRPLVGINNDNIYTIQSSTADRLSTLIGLVPNAEQTYGPLTSTDSFIVP